MRMFRGNRFIFLATALILAFFQTSCSSGSSDTELIESVIAKEREILSSGNTDLVASVWTSDAVIYHGNFTQAPQDDYLLYSGLSEIQGYYAATLSEIAILEYHAWIDELVIFDNAASCLTSAYLTIQRYNSSERDYFSYTGRPVTLTREGSIWKIKALTFYTE